MSLKFVVCVKEVPDTTEVKLDPETNTLIRSGVPSIISPFDMYACEEALRLRDELGGEVIGICMGPPSAIENLKKLIAMGLDNSYLVSDRTFAGSDTYATSTILATAIKTLIPDYSLVFAGRQAIDGDTGQVGPGIAEILDIPVISYIRSTLSINKKKAKFIRIMDDYRQEVEVQLPALATQLKGEKEPRLPSLRGMMKSKKVEIPIITNKKLNLDPKVCGLNGSPTRVIRVFTPPKKDGGEIFNQPENVEKSVEFLLNALRD